MHESDSRQAQQYKTIWLSDIHLGYKGCRAEYLLDFLHKTECDTLYLVGDIIDIWSMKNNFYWPQSHNNVIRTLLGKAKRGTRIIYIPGNHDEVFREYIGMVFGNIEIYEEFTHVTQDGKRLLLLHGDKFDDTVRINRTLGMLGDAAYEGLIFANSWYNHVRKRIGYKYRSITGFFKNRVANVKSAVQRFEKEAVNEARSRGYDGIVCGHIHHAEIKHLDGILYCNDGDWIENCTAMVEHEDGSLHILHWSDYQETLKVIRIKAA